MADFNPIEPFKPGPSISAGHLNQLKDGIKNVSGQSPIVVTEQGNTVYISLGGEGDFFFVGEIDSSGQPSDYSDVRYFVQRKKLSSSDTSELTWENETYPDSDVITVTNLWETSLSSDANHVLSDGQEVMVFRLADRAVPPQDQYVINIAGPKIDMLFCKIVTPAALDENKLISTANPCDSNGGNTDSDTTLFIFHKWRNDITSSDMTTIPHLETNYVVPYYPFRYDPLSDSVFESCGILQGEFCLPAGGLIDSDSAKVLQLTDEGKLTADNLVARTP